MFGLTSDTSVPIMTWLGNSVLVTVIITASRVFFDSLAGYALSRLHFRGRGVMFMALLAVMSGPGVVLLVPKFLIVTYLGIFDTYTAMILPLTFYAQAVCGLSPTRSALLLAPMAIASTIENRKYRMNWPAWAESSAHNSFHAVRHRLRRRNMIGTTKSVVSL